MPSRGWRIRCAAPGLPGFVPARRRFGAARGRAGSTSGSTIRRRKPRNPSPGCPGPVIVVTGSPGWRDRRRPRPVALRPGRVRLFGPTPEQSGIYSGTVADLVESLEEAHAAGRRRQRLKTCPPVRRWPTRSAASRSPRRSDAILPARRRPDRARLDGADLRREDRAPRREPARRCDGRRAPGPAGVPLTHRQHPRQRLPDAASDGTLNGRPFHGLEGTGTPATPGRGRNRQEPRGPGRSVHFSVGRRAPPVSGAAHRRPDAQAGCPVRQGAARPGGG